ncbi:MAG: hypothetical protein WCZ86_13940 [Desulfurivibrionaceae bacterium]|jgi:hypothetical protein
MEIEHEIIEIKAQIEKINSDLGKPSKFWAKNVLIPLFVAIIGVSGGVIVAIQNNRASQDALQETAKVDAACKFSGAIAKSIAHINDIVDSRKNNDSIRKNQLEDKLADDIGEVATYLSKIEMLYSDQVVSEAKELKEIFSKIETNDTEMITEKHEAYIKLNKFRDHIRLASLKQK